MTRRERVEARLQRRREWAASQAAKSAAAWRAAQAATDGIPLGQPILVGHHSERRHRAALARGDSSANRALEHGDMAKHHASKAANIEAALERTIFSDDPDAIEALEAKAAACDALAEMRKRANAAWKKARGAADFYALMQPPPSDPERRDLLDALSAHLAMWGARVAGDGRPFKLKYPPFSTPHPRAEARRCRKRIEQIKRRQAQAAAAEAAHGGALVTGIGPYVSVGFYPKPERHIRGDLFDGMRAAGYRWTGTCWTRDRAKLPGSVASIDGANVPEQEQEQP